MIKKKKKNFLGFSNQFIWFLYLVITSLQVGNLSLAVLQLFIDRNILTVDILLINYSESQLITIFAERTDKAFEISFTPTKQYSCIFSFEVFVGLGQPFEGPAALEALANGCFFLNPKVMRMTMLLEGESRTEYFAQAEKGLKYSFLNSLGQIIICENILLVLCSDKIHTASLGPKPLTFVNRPMNHRFQSQISDNYDCVFNLNLIIC